MRKKIWLAFILLMSFTILVAVGSSTWLIVDDIGTNVSPSYVPVYAEDNQSRVYNGTAKGIELKFESQSVDSSKCRVEYYSTTDLSSPIEGEPINAGDYKAKVFYEEKQIELVSYKVNKAPISLRANDAAITYGEASKDSGYTIASGELFNGDTLGNVASKIDPNIISNGKIDANTYEGSMIPVYTDNPNYAVTLINGSLTVNKKEMEFAWNVDSLSHIYDGKQYKPTALTVGKHPFGEKAFSPDISVKGATTAINAGTYTAVAAEESSNYPNYIISGSLDNPLEKEFNIEKRPIDVNLEVKDKVCSYTITDTETKNNVVDVTGDSISLEILYRNKSLADTPLNWSKEAPTEPGLYIAKASKIINSDSTENLNYKFNNEAERTIEYEIKQDKPELVTPVEVVYNQGSRVDYFTTAMNPDTITLSGEYNVPGTLVFNKGQKLVVGTNNYKYTFTPTDPQMKSVSGEVSINVYATIKFISAGKPVGIDREVQYGSKLVTQAAERLGYELGGYSYNGKAWAFDTDTVKSDMTLEAIWNIITYNITYNYNGGSANNPLTYTVEDVITLANPTKNGYNFFGWDGTGIVSTQSSVTIAKGSTGDRAYTASYRAISYTITLDKIYDGTFPTPNPESYTIETPTFTLVNPVRPGYDFIGWYDPKGNISIKHQTITIEQGSTGNITYYAAWEVAKHTVTFLGSDGSKLSEVKVEHGKAAAAPSYSYNEYQYVLNWLIDGTNTEADLTNITDDIIVKAQLTVRTYTVDIWYTDRDNVISGLKTNTQADVSSRNQVFNMATRIGKTTGTYAYGSTINIAKQVRIREQYNWWYKRTKPDTNPPAEETVSSARYIDIFYMSPVATFDWSSLGGSNENFVIKVDLATNTLKIVVLMVQPQAIITTGAFEGVTSYNAAGTYYQYMNDALDAAKNAASSTCVRIFGYRYGDSLQLYGNALLSNKTINQHNITIDGITYTIPKFIMDISGYTIDTVDSTYTIPAGVNVIVEYGHEDTSADGNWLKYKEGQRASGVLTAMTIPEGFTLTVNGTLTSGAIVGHTGTVYAHGVIMNNGTIINNSTISARGYIKGSGTVHSKSGSVIKDVFKMYNWPGGSVGKGMYDNNIFPFSVYSLHNISCETRIDKGSKYMALAQISASGAYASVDITLVGQGGLFEITEADGYIIKSIKETTEVTNINNSLTSSNQRSSVKEVLDLYGSFKDNSLTIDLGAMSVSTSNKLSMPIGFMDINLKRGTGRLGVNSYKFLPGAVLTIDAGTSLIIDAGTNIGFYDEYPDNYLYTDSNGDKLVGVKNPNSYIYHHKAWYDTENNGAKIYVNGTLESNGGFGGVISTTSSTGKAIFAKNTAKLNMLTSVTYKKFGASAQVGISDVALKMNLYNGNNILSRYSEVGSGTYFAIKDSAGRFGWYSQNANITFDTNGGTAASTLPTLNKTVGQSGYTILSADIPNVAMTREHYTFGGWYLDKECSDGQEAVGATIFASVVLHAKWTPVEYNISFVDKFANDFTTGNSNTPGMSFNILSPITPLDNLVFNDYIFGGYYLDAQCTNRIYDIDALEFVNYLNGNTVTIYIEWYPANSENYVIMYENTNNQVTCQPSVNIISTPQTVWPYTDLPDLGTLNTAFDAMYYFDGWTYNGQIITGVTKEMFASSTDNTIVLKAKWTKKHTITIKFGEIAATIYALNQNIPLPTIDQLISKGIDITHTIGKETDAFILRNILNWKCDGIVKAPGSEYIPIKDVIVEAILTTEKYMKVEFTTIAAATVNVTASNGGIITNLETGEVITSLTVTKSNTKVFVKAGTSLSLAMTYLANSYEGYQITEGDKVISSGKPAWNGRPPKNPGAFTIKDGMTYTVAASSGDSNACVPSGTLVTLSDGSRKKVEDLLPTDILRVFNHETGQYDNASIIFIEKDPLAHYDIINLKFSNGITSRLIYEHAYFDLTLNKYVYITKLNYRDFIGHSFAFDSNNASGYEAAVLVDSFITNEYTGCYSLITAKHMNFMVDGLLSIPGGIDGLFNIFEYDNDTLQYNQEKMKADIEMYGLYTYDDFKNYVPYEVYMAFPAPYFKVAVGKGMITYDDILALFKDYFESGDHNIIT